MQVSNDLKKWLANPVTQMSAAQIIYHQSMVIKAEFCVDHSFLPHQYINTGENNGQCLTSSLKFREIATSHSENPVFQAPKVFFTFGVLTQRLNVVVQYYRCTLGCKLLLWSTPKKKCERHKSLEWLYSSGNVIKMVS